MPARTLTTAQRDDLERLCREALAGPLAIVARALLESVRLAVVAPRRAPAPPQSTLWVVDADGLPPRPWRVQARDVVQCVALRCRVPAHVCVARQLASEVQRTEDTWRGEAGDYPHCKTEKCAQGRGIRVALDPCHPVVWVGAGQGKRLTRGRSRSYKASQMATRARLAAQGLLDDVPTMDGHGLPVDAEREVT